MMGFSFLLFLHIKIYIFLVQFFLTRKALNRRMMMVKKEEEKNTCNGLRKKKHTHDCKRPKKRRKKFFYEAPFRNLTFFKKMISF